MDHLKNWYPSHLRIDSQQGLYCHWMDLQDLPFTDPFVDETLTKALRFPSNSSRFRSTSSIDILAEWSFKLPCVTPTAFIFHVSRCGSTLLSQLLGLDPRIISLAEVPFIDDVLRLPFKWPDTPITAGLSHADLLTAAIRMYGQCRTGQENELFIKLDSWHITFWKQLRTLYPAVPFLLLYRQPDQVLRSHRQVRGMHAVPGLIEPAVLGFSGDAPLPETLDDHLIQVLTYYLETYLTVAQEDRQSVLLNYSDGARSLLQQVSIRCGLTHSSAHLEQAGKRSAFHSKRPSQAFVEAIEDTATEPRLVRAFEHYHRLESLRGMHA